MKKMSKAKMEHYSSKMILLNCVFYIYFIFVLGEFDVNIWQNYGQIKTAWQKDGENEDNY